MDKYIYQITNKQIVMGLWTNNKSIDILRERMSKQNRFPKISDKIKNILEYELDYIDRYNLSQYFLLIAEIYEYLKERRIYVSSHNSYSSIICYFLEISPINPIEYNLSSGRIFNSRSEFDNLTIIAGKEGIDLVNDWVEEKHHFFSKNLKLKDQIINSFTFDDRIDMIQQITIRIQQEMNVDIFPDKICLTDYQTIKFFQKGEMDKIPKFDSYFLEMITGVYGVNSIQDITVIFVRNNHLQQFSQLVIDKISLKYVNNITCKYLFETNNILLYQEQFMHIVTELTGFTEDQANDFRVVSGKKMIPKIAEYKNLFVKSFRHERESENLPKSKDKIATEIFEFLVNAGPYLFLKSYALQSTIIAYQIAYLKTHFVEL